MAGPSPSTAASMSTTVADENAKANSAAAKMAGDWSDLPKGHVLLKMSAALPNILAETGYAEMYGVELKAPQEGETAAPFTTLIILQKFLRANSNNISDATRQLTAALKWRKEFQPLTVMNEEFDKTKFEGLGYVAQLKNVPGSTNESDVCAFNIYGAVKNTKKTFGDLDGFIRWRVALMELTLQQLHLSEAKKPIPDFGKGADPYQAYQVHDYLSVSFLRQPAEVKAASQKTIKLFQEVYPETMAKKYFVNVPIFMQWVFAAMQLFMAKETIAKMKWMSYGGELHKDLGSSVPTPYGGSGAELGTNTIAPRYDGIVPLSASASRSGSIATTRSRAQEIAVGSPTPPLPALVTQDREDVLPDPEGEQTAAATTTAPTAEAGEAEAKPLERKEGLSPISPISPGTRDDDVTALPTPPPVSAAPETALPAIPAASDPETTEAAKA